MFLVAAHFSEHMNRFDSLGKYVFIPQIFSYEERKSARK